MAKPVFIYKGILFALAGSLICSLQASAEVPGECVQLPERTRVCPNELYKRSPVDVPPLAIKAGEMVCICMADFSALRIEASSQVEKINQKAELTRSAIKLGMSEQDLLSLIRN